MEKSDLAHFSLVSELWCERDEAMLFGSLRGGFFFCFLGGFFATSTAAQVDSCLMTASLVGFCQHIARLLF
jgi:hypothetical protein